MPTSLPQLPAPAFPSGVTRMAQASRGPRLQWETASYSVLLPTREHGYHVLPASCWEGLWGKEQAWG